MKKMLLAVVFSAGILFAAEKEYVGADGGNWGDAANWSPVGVPTQEDIAVFNRAVSVDIPDTVSYSVGGLHFNADATIVTRGPYNITDRKTTAPALLILPEGTSTVFVAENVIATIGADLAGSNTYKTTFVKRGKGSVRFKGFVGYKNAFGLIDIIEGEFITSFGSQNDGLSALLMHIADGGIVNVEGDNQYYNYMRIDIDEGGVYNANARNDTIGGISGSGVATNMNLINFTLGGDVDYKFSGVCHTGSGAIYFGRENLVNVATQRFIIASANAAAAAKFLVYPGWWDKLKFDSGVGEFNVKGIVGNGCEVDLAIQDIDGNPIRLNTMLVNAEYFNGGAISGTGSLGMTKIVTLSEGNPQLNLSGMLGSVAGMTMIFGNGENSFSLGNVSGLFTDNGTLRWNILDDYIVDVPTVATNGTLQQWGKGKLTLSSVNFSNVLVRTEDYSGGMTILSGQGNDVNIQNNSTNGAFTLQGCDFKDVKINSGTKRTTPVVLKDNNLENLNIAFNSAVDFAQSVVFDGGTYVITNNNVGIYSSNTVHVKSGDITFLQGQSCKYNLHMMPWTFTGGRSVFYHPCSWNQGFGADISGEGTYVQLVNTNQYWNEVRPYRVASDGYSHIVRVRDGAHFVSDALLLISPGTTLVSTGGVEIIDGALWTMNTKCEGLGSSDLAWSYLYFNGGTLELGNAYDNATSGWAFISEKNHFNWIGPKGMTLKYAPLSYATRSYITIADSFSTHPDAETDGGIIKVGHGSFIIEKPLYIHGQYDHRDGNFRHMATSAEATMGFGNVILGDVLNDFVGDASYTAATDSGATFTLCGASELSFSHSSQDAGSSLTIGAPDAEENSVIIRKPGGALIISDISGADSLSRFGDGPCFVKVNGGVPTSEVTGLSTIPAFGIYAFSSQVGDRHCVAPLAYDSVKGFVLPSFTDNDFTKGVSSHVRVLNPMTLSEDASVGSLSVFGAGATALTLEDGVVLSVGDGKNPAPVVLNSSSHSHHTVEAKIEGGVIDFGDSEGMISSGLIKGNLTPSKISSVIAGENGLSICVPQDAPIFLALSGANIYNGDTHINNALVYVYNHQAFSSSKVYIHGAGSSGGALYFDTPSMVFANPLYVSGYGVSNIHDTSVKGRRGQGALRTMADTTFTGDITLGEGTTCFFNNKTATFTGNISDDGAECLELAGVGTFVFSGKNTFTNTLRVCEGATLRLDSIDSVGSGPICVEGKLLVSVDSKFVFPNKVYGNGEIIIEGAGVGFNNLSEFFGAMKMVDESTFDLIGVDVKYQSLVGSGVVTNSQSEAKFTISSIDDTVTEFSGLIKGDISFVKTGKGVQHLSGNSTYTGSTTIDNGTLVLRGRDISNVLPVKGAVLRLDTTSLPQFADGTPVNEWADADGREWTFSNSDTDKCPTFDSQILNGKPGLWFGVGSATKLFCDNTTFQTRTVFAVYRTSSGSHTWSCAGFFGRTGYDKGLRFNTISQWSSSGWDTRAIYYAINGVGGVSSFEKNKPTVMMAEYDSNITSPSYAVGDYWSSATYNTRFFYGWMGELIVYDRTLSDDEKLQVNDYLMKKWSVKEYPFVPTTTNALPETTALIVSGEGVLDLAGGVQRVSSLSGDGLITNSALEVAELIISGEAQGAFTGRISDNIKLIFENDGSIDLGGSSISVSSIEGSGRIANGTVEVDEISPGGKGKTGTLVFESAPASGATYVCDGFAEKTDKIVIEGDFDISTLAFRYERSNLNGFKFEILSVGGVRTGDDFASVSGVNGAWYITHDIDNSSYLKYRGGTVILFK